MSALLSAQLAVWLGGVAGHSLRQFQRAFEQADKVQSQTLAQILRSNQKTTFGIAHGFSSIKNFEEYRKQVPILSYEDHRPYIDHQILLAGPQLTEEPAVLYAQTSGTTGTPKYIPITASALRSYRRAQAISCAARYAAIEGIFSGTLLALVSPAKEGVFESGIPFGSMSGLVNESLPLVVRRRAVLPDRVYEIQDYDERYETIASMAIADRQISCMASANPSTFIRLADIVRRQLGRDSIQFRDIWPRLRAIVTWTSANCALLLPKLRELAGSDIQIADMGYMASEFWGTIVVDPLKNLGCPTIFDNFFEFAEADAWEAGSRETLQVNQIAEGKKYFVIVTTSAGLYRYFMNDLVEVIGRHGAAPAIAFVQKGKGVTSLTGEKLYESQVTEAVEAVIAKFRFDIAGYLMLADRQSFGYSLYVESDQISDPLHFGDHFHEMLCTRNLEFQGKVASGRLKRAEVKIVRPGTFEALKQGALKLGQRETQYKLLRLQYSDELKFDLREFIVS